MVLLFVLCIFLRRHQSVLEETRTQGLWLDLMRLLGLMHV